MNSAARGLALCFVLGSSWQTACSDVHIVKPSGSSAGASGGFQALLLPTWLSPETGGQGLKKPQLSTIPIIIKPEVVAASARKCYVKGPATIALTTAASSYSTLITLLLLRQRKT